MTKRVLTSLEVDGDIELSGDIVYSGLSAPIGGQSGGQRTYSDLKVKPVGYIPVVIGVDTYYVPYYS